MFRDGSTRRGHALVELLIAALIFGIIAAAAGATFTAQSRLARRAADRSEVLSAVRGVAAILSHELRTLDHQRDVASLDRDSARIRAFRGKGIVCAHDSKAAHVRYAGMRSPDPSKDSMLVMTTAGIEVTTAITAVSPSLSLQCTKQPGETVLAFAPDTMLLPGVILLVFEHGEYHLSNAALRYRRGAGGRQPLTSSVFEDDSTDLTPGLHAGMNRNDTVALRVRVAARPVPPSGALSPFTWRIPFLNNPLPLDSLDLS